MMRDIYPSGFNSFVTPFMLGMIFVLGAGQKETVSFISQSEDNGKECQGLVL